MLFRCLSILLVAGSCTQTYSAPQSQNFCGRVHDPALRPVSQATISLYSRDNGLQFSTRSDGEGKYCFERVPIGDYLLEGRAVSLIATPENVTINAAATVLPDLLLTVAPTSTEVTVTASGAPQLANETTKQLNVVDVSESLLLGEDNLASATRELPGLRITQTGGPGAFTTIQLRGLRTFDTAVLLDGMQLRDPSGTQADASSFISDLWFADTSRVEVLQGAGASLYGTNSIGGVINLVTDQGGGAFHGDLDLQGGMLGQYRGLLHLAGAALNNRLLYSLGGGQVNVTEGVDGDDRYRNAGGLASLNFILTSKIHVGVRVLGADVFGQLNNTPTATPDFTASATTGPLQAIPLSSRQINAAEAGLPYANGNANFISDVNDPDYSRREHFTSTLAFWEHAVTPTLSYRASYQLVSTDTDYVNGPAGLGFYQPAERTSTYYYGRIDTAQVTSEWQPVHGQLISVGYQFDREEFNNPSYVGVAPAFLSNTRVSQASSTVFAKDQIKLLRDRLQISLSGRWQSFDLTSPSFSGAFPVYSSAGAISPPGDYTADASAAYFLRSTGTKIRSHVGNAYRAPSLFERFGTYFDGSSFTAYGNPRLAPERAISVDGGIDQYFGSKAKISATYFYTRLQQTIAFDATGAIVNPATDPYGRFGGYYNTGGGIARGVELSFETKLPAHLLVRGAYTYTNSRDRISEYSDGLLQTPQIVPQLFSASISKQFGRHMDMEIDCLIGSHYLYPFSSNQSPYYSVPFSFEAVRQVNASAGYTIPLSEGKSVRIYTRLDNLNNQTYYEEGFRTPEFVARGGVQLFF